MSEVSEFIFETKHFTRSQWYVDPKSDDVMASHAIVTERVPISGKAPPGFQRFTGRGTVEVDTVMGRGEVSFEFPIAPAETIEQAFEHLGASEEQIRPKIIEQAKEQAVQQHEAMRHRIAVPGGPDVPPGMPPPGRRPSGIVLS